MQYLLNNTSLGPALFSSNNNIGSAENRSSCVYLVLDKANVIDGYKILTFFCLKGNKINEINPTLNAGLKASKELQLF